jgi:hypothetical protein
MFIEGCYDLNPLRTVVNLMKPPPEKVVLMAPTVPPIEDECGDEVSDQSAV